MNKGLKLLLGLASIWLPLYILLFMGVVAFTMFTQSAEPPTLWAVIIPLHLLTMLLTIGLMIFYIVNVFRNDRVDKDMKILWTIVLFMGGMIAMPIYWYLYIWREAAYPPAPHAPGSLAAGTTSIEDSSRLGTSRAISPDGEYLPPLQPPDWR